MQDKWNIKFVIGLYTFAEIKSKLLNLVLLFEQYQTLPSHFLNLRIFSCTIVFWSY
jgi:hypothetical protein